jgi:hypothetical protein
VSFFFGLRQLLEREEKNTGQIKSLLKQRKRTNSATKSVGVLNFREDKKRKDNNNNNTKKIK